MTTPYPWQPQPGDPRPPEPQPPPDSSTPRFLVAAILLALALVASTLLFAPPASAHGGDGRTAPCATPNAIDISPTKCGNAFIVGNIVYANVTDKKNEGHCVRVEASHPATHGWSYVGQACKLGVNTHVARVMPDSSIPWNRVRIRDHRYVTVCGWPSGRSC